MEFLLALPLLWAVLFSNREGVMDEQKVQTFNADYFDNLRVFDVL